MTKNIWETFGSILPSAVNSGTDMEQFLIELDYDYTANQLSNALTELNPEIYSSFVDMEFIKSQEFIGDIVSRMHQLSESELHLNSRPNLQGIQNIAEARNGKVEQVIPPSSWNQWTQSSGLVIENGKSKGSGYDIKSGKITVGADNQLYDWLLAVAATGVNRSNLTSNFGDSSGDQTGMHIALYGDMSCDSFYLNSIMSYGDFDNNSARKMDTFNTNTRARNLLWDLV